MASEEGKAFGFFTQQHGSQVAMANADFAVISYGTGDAEALQADADRFGSSGGFGAAFLDGDRSADNISPGRVLKRDRLGVFADLVGVDTFSVTDSFSILDGGDTVLSEGSIDLRNSPLLSRGLNYS
jgi:hypothetical protein